MSASQIWALSGDFAWVALIGDFAFVVGGLLFILMGYGIIWKKAMLGTNDDRVRDRMKVLLRVAGLLFIVGGSLSATIRMLK
jgi:hypothetical protein